MKSAENDGPTKSRPLLQASGHSTVFSVVTSLKFNPNKIIIQFFLNKFFKPLLHPVHWTFGGCPDSLFFNRSSMMFGISSLQYRISFSRYDSGTIPDRIISSVRQLLATTVEPFSSVNSIVVSSFKKSQRKVLSLKRFFDKKFYWKEFWPLL